MSCPCGLSQDILLKKNWIDDKQICIAVYEKNGKILKCGKLFSAHCSGILTNAQDDSLYNCQYTRDELKDEGIGIAGFCPACGYQRAIHRDPIVGNITLCVDKAFLDSLPQDEQDAVPASSSEEVKQDYEKKRHVEIKNTGNKRPKRK